MEIHVVFSFRAVIAPKQGALGGITRPWNLGRSEYCSNLDAVQSRAQGSSSRVVTIGDRDNGQVDMFPARGEHPDLRRTYLAFRRSTR
jgi:hypothetical protein